MKKKREKKNIQKNKNRKIWKKKNKFNKNCINLNLNIKTEGKIFMQNKKDWRRKIKNWNNQEKKKN